MCLTRLLYFSENTMDSAGGSALSGLRKILSTSKRNNQAAGITGALVFDDFWFLQALEGERAKVWETLRRIEQDQRHSNLVVAEAREVDSRLFGNWWMGLATRTEQTVAAFEPYMRNGLLQPRNMAADDILKLMMALCGPGLSRKLAAVA